MKIGHTIRSVQERVDSLQGDPFYKPLHLGFLLAIAGQSHEWVLHRHFEDYRARYRWTDPHGKRITVFLFDNLTHYKRWLEITSTRSGSKVKS